MPKGGFGGRIYHVGSCLSSSATTKGSPLQLASRLLYSLVSSAPTTTKSHNLRDSALKHKPRPSTSKALFSSPIHSFVRSDLLFLAHRERRNTNKPAAESVMGVSGNEKPALQVIVLVRMLISLMLLPFLHHRSARQHSSAQLSSNRRAAGYLHECLTPRTPLPFPPCFEFQYNAIVLQLPLRIPPVSHVYSAFLRPGCSSLLGEWRR